MNFHLSTLLIVAMAGPVLAGCPPPDQPQDQADAQVGDTAPPLADTPPPIQDTGGGALPSFDTLISDGPTVTVSGVVNGADAGQLDFLAAPEKGSDAGAVVVHVDRFADGKFSVTAPATFERPLYLSAIVTPEGEPPSPSHPTGGTPEPIQLNGLDVVVAITIGEPLDPALVGSVPETEQPTLPVPPVDAPEGEPAADPAAADPAAADPAAADPAAAEPAGEAPPG